ncbi:MAG TPA: SUF system NifU family Fe-S cluster assembly protein [Acholeplasmataceae bacterium]|jgi:nitrogen fixation NifU-like protein|nr:SUF system NifU family Fe-S cluster assembly protein [Acholeplasmataceae bacterium]
MNLENLYRQVILDHYKNPRNKGLKGYPKIHLKNPSCGDDITVEAKIKDGVLEEINHEGTGCSICCSSASVLTETLSGKTVEKAEKLINEFYSMIKGEDEGDEELGEALVYQGVSQFPARIKCATLPWKALERLLKGDDDE